MWGLFLMQWLWGAPGTKEPAICIPRNLHSFCSDPVFLPTEEFQALLKRLPSDRFLNSTAISQYWIMDTNIQHRYQQLGGSLKVLLKKMHRIVRRLFNLCKRCHRQPRFRLPKERWAFGVQIRSPALPGHSCWGQVHYGWHGRIESGDTFSHSASVTLASLLVPFDHQLCMKQ